MDENALVQIQQRVKTLRRSIDELNAGSRWVVEATALVRAVEMTVEHFGFYHDGQVKAATDLLNEADRRIDVIRDGGSWWDVMGIPETSTVAKSVIGGHRSHLDGSVQPYSLVIPAGFDRKDASPHRLDVWLHGRDEKVSEIAFYQRAQRSTGQYTPVRTFVLHPYGRYSNAFKFAGEVDVLEALDHVQSRVPIDRNRVSIRGFSMGGAGCWQMATRYSDRWFAANPGAGFSETPEFLRFFQAEELAAIPHYQRKMWQWYDSPQWVENLRHCPTVVYSGEIDRQRQAATIMEAAFKNAGMTMRHVIGKSMGHTIDADSKTKIAAAMDDLATNSDSSPPRKVHLTTYTTRYHQMHWIDVTGLLEHWRKSTVDANVTEDNTIVLETKNISTLNIDLERCPVDLREDIHVVVNGRRRLSIVSGARETHSTIEVRCEGEDDVSSKGLRKRPDLQGPIDDAFCQPFVFVVPTIDQPSRASEKWAVAEMKHATQHWVKHFRGDVVSLTDVEALRRLGGDGPPINANVVAFGTPRTNALLAECFREADWPLRWDDECGVEGHLYDCDAHALVAAYPNPLDPANYLVINSGFTFAEYDYLNNARQTPKLPDWAVIDLSVPRDATGPGRVVDADFFDERWLVKPR